MLRVGLVGLGKMGLSHYAIANALEDASVVAVCDSSSYLLGIMSKRFDVAIYSRVEEMLQEAELDAVVIATPSHLHEPMVRTCLERSVAVFCEKPFSLDAAASRELAAIASERRVVTQVGYHYRFVGAFQEVKRLIDAGAIGPVSHVLAEAYGPVVTAPSGTSWRGQKSKGGGALYDYGAHPLNLLTWLFGVPTGVVGTVFRSVFSSEAEDIVSSTVSWPTIAGQLSVDWSDESQRKMTTKLTIWGEQGRIFADRQECQVYLRRGAVVPSGYDLGWNVKYTTELTAPVTFYLRGEEYTAQMEAFFSRVRERRVHGENDFSSAADTDLVLQMILADAHGAVAADGNGASKQAPLPDRNRRSLLGRRG